MTSHTPARILDVRWRLRGLGSEHLRYVLDRARRDGHTVTRTEALLELRRRRPLDPAPPPPPARRHPLLRRNPGLESHLERALWLLAAAGELTRAALAERLGLGPTRTDHVLRRLLDDRRIRRADRPGDPRSWFALRQDRP